MLTEAGLNYQNEAVKESQLKENYNQVDGITENANQESECKEKEDHEGQLWDHLE